MARTSTQEVLPFWRSELQPVILQALSTGTGRTASDIARREGASPVAVARAARPLIEAGIVVVEPIGRTNVLSLDYSHPATEHLVALANLTAGLLADLRTLFDLAGVARVVVFGSWARRHRGEPGRTPRDVDVYVETFDETAGWAVRERCLAIGGKNDIAVDLTTMPSNRGQAFVSEYLDGPTIEVRPAL